MGVRSDKRISSRGFDSLWWSADLVRDAVMEWLAHFADQRFSLVDAVSFEVMRQAGVSHAFAFDKHFEVAGFALLR